DGMAFNFRRWRLARQYLLTTAALICLAGSVQAQIPNLLPAKPATETVKPAEAPAPGDQRAAAEALLAEARRQQEAARLEDGSAPATDDLPANERQRVLDRLVLVYGERVNLIDETATLKKSAAEMQDKPALAAEFSGPPPYPTLRIDALRDEFDLMRERLKHRESTRLVLENQKQGLIEAQRRASEALRLADDRLARAKGETELKKERANRELAALRLQLSEAELTNVGIVLQGAQAEIQALELSTAETQRLVTRVLASQTLPREDVDKQQTRLRDALSKLAGEIDRRAAINTRRLADRERLAKSLAAGDPSEATGRQLKLLDETLETDRMEMTALRWLQTIGQRSIDSWDHRFVVLGSGDAAARESAIAELGRIKADLETKRPLLRELEATEQEAIAQQELRLKDALLDSEATAREAAILETQKQRVQAIQRVELAVTKMDRQLGRWMGDFGVSAKSAAPRDWKVIALQAVGLMKQVWNFELFAVEDSTVVEGKTVTTSYGVTVGKSIGVLLLYAFAYWLFAMLTRLLGRLMVRRFKVDPQVASVMRRWLMIAVSVVLIILILNLARIPLTAFAFMGGALAIGIGFGTQTIIKNVISGIIILFERKIRVGDIIAIGGTTGHVTAVDLRASTVRSFDGVEALVPNSTFLENQVVNWTYSNSRIRREIKIGIAYGSPVRQAADVIVGCALEHGQVLKEPPPEVYLEDFADNAILMVLIFWVELSPTLSGRRVDSDLRFMMEKRLAAAGIAIPFPQRDIRVSVAEALPVRMVPPAAEPAN
ncbi:MAG: mechanosensitive ion channel domain-containing protein, partial [Azonexus sp.]